MDEQKAEPVAQAATATYKVETFLTTDGRRITRLTPWALGQEVMLGVRYRGHAALQGPGGEPGPDYEFEIVAPSLEEAFAVFAARAQEAGEEVAARLEAAMRRRLLQNPGVGLKHVDPRLKDLRGGPRRG